MLYTYIHTYIYTYIHIYIYVCLNVEGPVQAQGHGAVFRSSSCAALSWPAAQAAQRAEGGPLGSEGSRASAAVTE